MIDPISQITLANVAKFLLSYGPKIYTLLRNEKSRLLAIEAKIDQLIIREIQSSFQIVDSLSTVASDAMRDRHLTQAEANLLKNIALDPNAMISGRASAYWVAKCYFGLCLVATLRKETAD